VRRQEDRGGRLKSPNAFPLREAGLEVGIVAA
jgi:hypothetical protein